MKGPTPERDRIEVLDALRGFAVLGIFLVNMTADLPWGDRFDPAALKEPDRTSLLLTDLLFSGKFFTIFSFLFGIGFFIQMDRMRTRGARSIAIYLRRAAGLFVIGAVFYTMGLGVTILLLYSIFSLVLLIFFRRSSRTILIAAAVCLATPSAFNIAIEVIPKHGVVETHQSQEHEGASGSFSEDRRERFFLESSFSQVVARRFRSGVRELTSPDFYLYSIDQLGLMLLGCFFGRRILAGGTRERIRLCRLTFPWLMGIGSVGTIGVVVAKYFVELPVHSAAASVAILLWEGPLGWYALGLGYAAGVMLLYERVRWRRLLHPFCAVGRTALTNYVLQGFIVAFICFGWGLGMYGKYGPFAGLAAAIAIYPVQVIASAIWLRVFRQGPLEWLWRLMTYGRAPMMR